MNDYFDNIVKGLEKQVKVKEEQNLILQSQLKENIEKLGREYGAGSIDLLPDLDSVI